MNNKKINFRFFTIPQYRQEENYLSKMHEKGWKFVSVTFPGFYKFEKCTPSKTSYRLDYNQEARNNMSDYIQMFADCGWNHILDFVGYSYFRKENCSDGEDEEIFSDDSSRLDMMNRVFKGRITPLIIIFICVIIPQLYQAAFGHLGTSVFMGGFIFLALLYIIIFTLTGFQYYKFEKKVSGSSKGLKYKYLGIFSMILIFFLCISGIVYASNRTSIEVKDFGSDKRDGFSIESQIMNDEVLREYKLKKGDKIIVKHEHDVGELFISISANDKDPIFYGNGEKLGLFDVEIQEDGLYTIICSGKKMKGTVKFEIARVENSN